MSESEGGGWVDVDGVVVRKGKARRKGAEVVEVEVWGVEWTGSGAVASYL